MKVTNYSRTGEVTELSDSRVHRALMDGLMIRIQHFTLYRTEANVLVFGCDLCECRLDIPMDHMFVRVDEAKTFMVKHLHKDKEGAQ